VKTGGAIKNGQFRDTGNIGHTIQIVDAKTTQSNAKHEYYRPHKYVDNNVSCEVYFEHITEYK
jgi:hypothetical protein